MSLDDSPAQPHKASILSAMLDEQQKHFTKNLIKKLQKAVHLARELGLWGVILEHKGGLFEDDEIHMLALDLWTLPVGDTDGIRWVLPRESPDFVLPEVVPTVTARPGGALHAVLNDVRLMVAAWEAEREVSQSGQGGQQQKVQQVLKQWFDSSRNPTVDTRLRPDRFFSKPYLQGFLHLANQAGLDGELRLQQRFMGVHVMGLPFEQHQLSVLPSHDGLLCNLQWRASWKVSPHQTVHEALRGVREARSQFFHLLHLIQGRTHGAYWVQSNLKALLDEHFGHLGLEAQRDLRDLENEMHALWAGGMEDAPELPKNLPKEPERQRETKHIKPVVQDRGRPLTEAFRMDDQVLIGHLEKRTALPEGVREVATEALQGWFLLLETEVKTLNLTGRQALLLCEAVQGQTFTDVHHLSRTLHYLLFKRLQTDGGLLQEKERFYQQVKNWTALQKAAALDAARQVWAHEGTDLKETVVAAFRIPLRRQVW